MTLSLVARCTHTGQFGVAAATAMPAVGKLLTHAAPRTGAIATQARVNPYLGFDGLRYLRQRLSAEDVSSLLQRADPRIEARQFAVIDAAGRVQAFTGKECLHWAGALPGEAFSVQGNRLAGPQVLHAAAEAMHQSTHLTLAERFILALEAGVAAGGDTEGEKSATIYIVDSEEYPLWDVRVDLHETPVTELRRLHDAFREELIPEICKMPSRRDPGGRDDEPWI